MSKRKTAGQVSQELAVKSVDNSHSAHDQMRENLIEYDKMICQCIETGKKEFAGDFYVVVITKKERLMQNVLRNYFLTRESCPTPQYDEAVYKFHKKDDRIEFLWVVPAKDVCEYIIENALLIPEEERDLLNFVLQFTNGDLDVLAKKLNGEIEGA